MSTTTVSMQSTREGSAHVASLSGRIDHTTSDLTGELLRAALQAVAPPQTALVLRMQDVPYISSAGLRVLMVISREAKAKGVQMLVTELQPVVLEVFRISHFDMVIPVHSDAASAIASLS